MIAKKKKEKGNGSVELIQFSYKANRSCQQLTVTDQIMTNGDSDTNVSVEVRSAH